jgi:hypothetical protein
MKQTLRRFFLKKNYFENGLKTRRLDIKTTALDIFSTLYSMPHKADTSVICQCGAIINKYYYRTHIQTAKHATHARDMIGRENIEVAEAWKYKPPRN